MNAGNKNPDNQPSRETPSSDNPPASADDTAFSQNTIELDRDARLADSLSFRLAPPVDEQPHAADSSNDTRANQGAENQVGTIDLDLDPELDELLPVARRVAELADLLGAGAEDGDAADSGHDSFSGDTADFDTPTAISSDAPSNIGKYLVRRVLGRGGQASAFLAMDPDLRRHVVLKVYHAAATAEQKDQVLREGQSLARVRSPYVAQCYGAERESNGVPYLVMEYIAGKTLAHSFQEKLPSETDALELTRKIALGVAEVHACGLIHRDIKPGNVILGDDGNPRLVDFGLASCLGSDELSRISGTPRFMPPEQARGELERVDHRSDIFGTGALLYALLTGRAPFEASSSSDSLQLAQEGDVVSPRELRPEISQQVDELCMECLAKSPANRYESARQLVARIEQLQTTAAAEIYLKPESAAEGWRSPRTVLQAVLVVAVSLAVLLFAASAARKYWRRDTLASSAVQPPAAQPNTQRNTRQGEKTELTKTGGASQLDAAIVERHPDGRALRRDFRLQVEIVGARKEAGRTTLTEGDAVSIRLNAEKDCYVAVWSVEAEMVVQLFPNDAESDFQLSAGRDRLVPSEKAPDGSAGKMIRVTPSTGSEFIHVVASTKPLPKITGQKFGRYVVVSSEQDRLHWRENVRGMVLVAAEPDAKSIAVSEAVIPYQVVPAP